MEPKTSFHDPDLHNCDEATRLAADPVFLRWRMLGEEQDTLFWNNFIEEHPGKAAVVESAVRIVASVRMNDHSFTDEQKARQVAALRSAARRRRLLRVARISAAACLVAIAATFALWQAGRNTDVTTPEQQLAVLMGQTASRNIKLVMADQGVMEFDTDADLVCDEQGGLVVNNDRKIDGSGEPAEMNKLIVPGGRRSSLTLADGSKIWVNAGTTLEFPSVFASGRREIRVTGEVYIEVAKDPLRPFTLHTPDFSVLVTGTKFNVSAYAGDTRQSVVLAEGAVAVELPAGGHVGLRPSEMLSFENFQPRIDKVDPADHISWIDGILNFHAQPLHRVAAALSRYYNIPVECEDSADISISGRLVLFDDMATVLNNILVVVPVQYRIEQGRVVIFKSR